MKKIRYFLVALALLTTTFILIRNSDPGPQFLDAQFSDIINYIPERAKRNMEVSEVDVAWHLDHSLKTINHICEALEASNPNTYRSNFNFSRMVVFTMGAFPRGVAESPQLVRPPKTISTDSLYLQMEEARKNLKRIERLDKKVHFKHPYFNVIDKGQTKRFLKIHTDHHLKIVRDILKN
ncbi:DUF1569 domain-containing protein [Flagellimonas allohymeniacidonis]|uniref:DUF1569 domain-containing protein n=1 Tax=Flagellimonas allohymeniacidonis TaxID=2517819 RepID=A0A4Q8QC01_9FLAO|nr:DUF1569 domain-containing protein [Allomuricauda hymeniacidonis]TAI47885.1 DUF1569 domain-containing protein [Allomuricauda hymeniacidonis]